MVDTAVARKLFLDKFARALTACRRPDGSLLRYTTGSGLSSSLRLTDLMRLLTAASSDGRSRPLSLVADLTTLFSSNLSDTDRLEYRILRWCSRTLSIKVL